MSSKKKTESEKTSERSEVKANKESPPQKRFTKGNLLSGLFVSLAIAMTVGFYSPLDVYLSSQNDFMIGFSTVFPVFVCITLVLFAGLFLIMFLALLIHPNLFRLFRDLFLGVLIAMYIQMMFLNGRMALVTGDENHYLDLDFPNYFNFILLFLIAFAPVFLWCAKNQYKENKFLSKLTDKTMIYLCGALILIQGAGAVGTFFSFGIRNEDEGLGVHMLSYKKAMQLGSEQNVVVLLVDRMDSLWLDEELEKYPETKDVFKGFTFYRDNVSKYTNTFPAVPSMLTGYEFSGQPIGEFIKDAWASDNYVKKIKESGCRFNLIGDVPTTLRSLAYVEGIADTFDTLDSGFSINYMGSGGVVEIMTKLSLMKVSPYFVKGFVGNRLYGWSVNEFFIIEQDDPARADNIVTAERDLAFYNYLKKYKLNTTGGEKAYTFIHLNGCHDESDQVAKLNESFPRTGKSANRIETMRGCFEILEEYFDQMKQLGIYDDSTIIVLGDHARPPYAVQQGSDRMDSELVTGLMIKPAGAKNDPLKIDDTTPMSNEYFGASIVEYCGLDHSGYGVSYNDVINKGITPDRTVNIYNFRSQNASPDFICKYTIKGNSRDFGNWIYSKE